MSGHQTEPSANTALAGLLNGMMSGCQVRAEHTRLVAGRAGLQLDIAITAPDRAPVALEAEYFPARSVEAEAAGRLGLPVVHESTPIEAAIALRYPQALASADDLRAAIAGATLSWCVFSQNEQDTQRFPAAGWLTGSVADLADLIRLVSIPQHAVEDGPYGGTRLTVGDELAGEMLTAPCPTNGAQWGTVRLLDAALAQTAYALARSQLWLPATAALELKTAPLGVVGRLGLVDRDITGPPPRGPFTKAAASPTATYPALWNHEAKKETQMLCAPDSQLLVRPSMEDKAAEVWTTASRVHLNREYTFGSQPIAVAFTERTSIGGTAWPNVIFNDEAFDYAFAVWGNSTLGLLSYWWHASRQQSSKARLTIRSAETLPVLDFRALSPAQLATARAIFDEFRTTALLPAHLAAADPNRARLDRGVVRDLLGFTEATWKAVRRLAAKWCAEPSVHGGKGRV